MTYRDVAERELRDFNRYTGDGLPDEPTAAALPEGDPGSGVYNVTKEGLRRLHFPLSDVLDDVGAAVDAAILAAGFDGASKIFDTYADLPSGVSAGDSALILKDELASGQFTIRTYDGTAWGAASPVVDTDANFRVEFGETSTDYLAVYEAQRDS